MRKIAAIFFLVLFTASTTEAGQLLKVPLLITHFLEHLRDGRSHSLVDFLKEHYGNDHAQDEDSTEDEKLPFKSALQSNFSNVYVLPLSLMSPVVTDVADLVYNVYHQPRLTNYHADIFHPP